MKKISMLCIFVLLLTSVSVGFAESDSDIVGMLSNDKYENEFFGVGCSFPSWEFSALNASEASAQLSQGFALVLQGHSANNFNMLQVMILDLTADETLPESVDELIQMIGDGIINALTGSGSKFDSVECDKYDLAGQEEASAFCKGTVNNGTSSAYLRMVAIKKDQYVLLSVGITAGSNKTDDIFSRFYRLEQ